MSYMKKKRLEEREEEKEEERQHTKMGLTTILKRKTQSTTTSVREGGSAAPAAAPLPPPPICASQPIINLPPNYQYSSDANEGIVFVHPLPYIVGYRKYHMLNRPWIITLKGHIEGYLTSANSIGVWNMNKIDIITINSAIYDFINKRQLHGHVIYLGDYEHQQVELDRMSKFLACRRRQRPRVISPDDIRFSHDFSQVEGELSLKITGFYEEMVVGHIYALITVDCMRLKRRPFHDGKKDVKKEGLYANNNVDDGDDSDDGDNNTCDTHICSDNECVAGERANDDKENGGDCFFPYTSSFL